MKEGRLGITVEVEGEIFVLKNTVCISSFVSSAAETLQPSLNLCVGDTFNFFFIFEFVRKSSKIIAIVLFEKLIVIF